MKLLQQQRDMLIQLNHTSKAIKIVCSEEIQYNEIVTIFVKDIRIYDSSIPQGF